jgi:hypothetical protein
MVLFTQANANGRCLVTIDSLVTPTELTPQAVRAGVASLCESGWLKAEATTCAAFEAHQFVEGELTPTLYTLLDGKGEQASVSRRFLGTF